MLPRSVMVSEDELLVIDAENRLHRRRVTVVHSSAEHVVITEGLTAGDRINRTPIEFFIEGMAVKPQRSLPEAEAKSGDKSVNLEGWRTRQPGEFLSCHGPSETACTVSISAARSAALGRRRSTRSARSRQTSVLG